MFFCGQIGGFFMNLLKTFKAKYEELNLAAIFFIFSLLFLCFQASIYWGIDFFIIDIIYPSIILLSALLLSADFAFLLFLIESLGLYLIFYLQTNNFLSLNSSWKDYVFRSFDLFMLLLIYLLITIFIWIASKKTEKLLEESLKAKEEKNRLLEKLKYQDSNLEKIVDQKITDLKNYQFNQLAKVSAFVDMGKLAAGIIHNIRTPLAVISLSIDNLLKKNLSADFCEDNLNRAKNAVEMISDFSRISKNQLSQRENLDLFNLNHEINKLIRLFTYKASDKNIRIFFKSKKNYRLIGYREKLCQVIANILLNAIEAFEGIEKEDKCIFIRLERNKHYLLILIKDYATGISKENLKSLFQTNFTSKANKDGLGLGLFFSNEVMEKFYGNKIKVKSNLGEGTTFILRIKNKFILDSDEKQHLRKRFLLKEVEKRI